jgi:hypothetical protein
LGISFVDNSSFTAIAQRCLGSDVMYSQFCVYCHAQVIDIDMNVTVDKLSYKDIRDLSEANLTGLCFLLKNEV